MGKAPEKMYVTTDAVAFAVSATGVLEVALVERANDPYKRRWALPGGFVELDEDLADACARELEEETGLRPAAMAQIGAWGQPGRDPRGRNVSVAYLVVVGRGESGPVAGDDAARAAWFPVGDLPDLAFDHAEILSAALRKLRVMALSTHLVFAMLPADSFRLQDLREVLEAVRGAAVTLDQAAAVAECASLEIIPSQSETAPTRYRCTAADFLNPLQA